MRSWIHLAVVLVVAGCGSERDTTPQATLAPEQTAPTAEAVPDPLLAAVCRAHDEVVSEGVPEDNLLQHTAVRSIERGVTEAQLSELGATPFALLASIRARGNPPACARLVSALEARL